ncbi:MAG: C40 family peptidase [Alphaproteobacteria bacterium]|nr:C40 family peptidase [Alphaproteobacteria bacterium]
MASLDKRLNAFRDDLADSSLKGRVKSARFVDGAPRQVKKPLAPLRHRPAPGSTLVSELLSGETVRVFEEKGGFAWVQSDTDRYVGYIDADALSADIMTPTHVVAHIHTCLYPEPRIKAPHSAVLPMGAKVAVTGGKGRYSDLAGGGWAPAQHLAALDAFEDDFVAVAERFMGVPYVWGGRSSQGLDCSALVQLSLARCGVSLPRDSDMQETAVPNTVAFDGDETVLRRGDLVFWKGHVGIWIEPGRFLHANASDMCVATAPLSQVIDWIIEVEGTPVSSVRRPG